MRSLLLPFPWLSLFNKLAESMSMPLTGRRDLDRSVSLWCRLGFRTKLWVLLAWWATYHFRFIRDLLAPLWFDLSIFSLNAAVCRVWCLYCSGRRKDLFIQSFIQKSFDWPLTTCQKLGVKKVSKTWFLLLRSTWPHKEIDTKRLLWCSEIPCHKGIVKEKEQFLRS